MSQADTDEKELEDLGTEFENTNTIFGCIQFFLPTTGKLDKSAFYGLFIAIIIDITSCFILFWLSNDYTFPLDGSTISHDFRHYETGTADSIIMLWIRIVTLFVFMILCIRQGVPNELWPDVSVQRFYIFQSTGTPNVKHSYNAAENQKTALLNENDAVVSIVFFFCSNCVYVCVCASGNVGRCPEEKKKNRSHLWTKFTRIGKKSKITFDNEKAEEEYERRKQHCVLVKNGLLLLLFLLCTFYQGYIGVKCVLFHFANHVVVAQAFAFGGIVLAINMEIFCCKQFVDNATDFGEGVLLKELHPHPLYLQKKLKYWCDLCFERVKAFGYRCERCSFDICSACYKKHIKKQLQKKKIKKPKRKRGSIDWSAKHMSTKRQDKYVIRGDKVHTFFFFFFFFFGEKETKELTTRDYVRRAVTLVSPFWCSISIAFLCLLINSGTNLYLPAAQGRIFDKIINQDRNGMLVIVCVYANMYLVVIQNSEYNNNNNNNNKGFNKEVQLFIILSVITGFFGAIRNLCFNVVGRKLSISIRSRMFRSIIVQV
ncbi:hypothetical protein RFI_29880 [Reticulomyxa filosa]|uniref:ABC transmembrane type-1 domain-containing protein n=1 Tax=Reticulomyxa filosa TaxID=46433 RepID=X6M277_RETFI|nr:hypothetical protein RFI_29880 [Reticulomyxa filosa]|eukprot:ETO07512.1 hypothetical protein RFI_29880 [Reticulomyxa filosa]